MLVYRVFILVAMYKNKSFMYLLIGTAFLKPLSKLIRVIMSSKY